MSKAELQVAVIGCGRVAGHHGWSIERADGVRLAAVCDLIEDKAGDMGARFGVPFYTSYHRMLAAHPDIDIVAIITPSGMHYEHAAEIIELYGKHVIVEKPTFMRPEQALAAWELAASKGIKIFPVFQNRYNLAVQRVRSAISSGELGPVRIVSVRVRWCRPQRYYDMSHWRGTYSHDGGALTNQGIHHVDLIRYLGGEVTRVGSVMRTLGAEIEVEDTIAASLEYDSGAVGTLEVTTAARPDDFEASISLVCEKGLAQIGGIAVNELQVFTPDPSACAPNSEEFAGIDGKGAVYGHGHNAMYRDIVAHFSSGAPYPVSDEDCLGTLRLLHAFYRADEAGGPVPVKADGSSNRLGRPDEKISDLYRTPRP